jgi:hypothetical protein
MKIIDYNNQVQKEAILNECKGNLFEFLVTQSLARKSSCEDLFLLNLPLDFKNQLSFYEDLIRTHAPDLLVQLPKLSQETVNKIWQDLRLFDYKFLEWKVIGKMVATNDNEYWNETDIVGTYQNENGSISHLAISLKLTKDHSFTNTKSAGVKSFLTKYFSNYGELAHNLQVELNSIVDESFLMMGHNLYSLIDREFKGSFNSEWSDTQTELPGELSPSMRVIVHQNYHRVALKLASLLEQLKELNNNLFFDSLAALCGFGHSEIIQVSCFHHEYELVDVTIKNFNDFFKATVTDKECHLLPIKDLASSVEVVIGKMILQIRVKPMNKFTTAAYKINCSIKVKV